MYSSFEIYMALYQQLTDGQGTDIFKQFSEDFFDLIIVDECHRGSAADDSNWKKILEYYKSATQIGLTATPKETNEISNIQYDGYVSNWQVKYQIFNILESQYILIL